MPGVEFFANQPDGDAEAEELLAQPPQRKLPRWLVALGVLAVLGAAVCVVVNRQHQAPAAHQAAPTPPAAQLPPVHIPSQHPAGQPRIGRHSPVLDVAVGPNDTWLLQSRSLLALDRSGTGIEAVVPDRTNTGPAQEHTYRLVQDPSRDVIWVVDGGSFAGRALKFDARSLALIGQARLPMFVDGAAALHGHLYVSTGRGVYEAAPKQRPRLVFGVHDGGPVVADRTRGRLLVTAYGARTRIWAINPAAHHAALVAGRAAIAPANVVVTGGGAIWLAGFDNGAGALVRLDPKTLLPVRRAALAGMTEPGIAALGAGTDVIWIREADSAGLQCIDARTGRQEQTFGIDGPVASVGAGWGPPNSVAPVALVGTARGAVPLRMTSCLG